MNKACELITTFATLPAIKGLARNQVSQYIILVTYPYVASSENFRFLATLSNCYYCQISYVIFTLLCTFSDKIYF